MNHERLHTILLTIIVLQLMFGDFVPFEVIDYLDAIYQELR